jgi:hypothetical protein
MWYFFWKVFRSWQGRSVVERWQDARVWRGAEKADDPFRFSFRKDECSVHTAVGAAEQDTPASRSPWRTPRQLGWVSANPTAPHRWARHRLFLNQSGRRRRCRGQLGAPCTRRSFTHFHGKFPARIWRPRRRGECASQPCTTGRAWHELRQPSESLSRLLPFWSTQ